jgi:hypothetical protein
MLGLLLLLRLPLLLALRHVDGQAGTRSQRTSRLRTSKGKLGLVAARRSRCGRARLVGVWASWVYVHISRAAQVHSGSVGVSGS